MTAQECVLKCMPLSEHGYDPREYLKHPLPFLRANACAGLSHDNVPSSILPLPRERSR